MVQTFGKKKTSVAVATCTNIPKGKFRTRGELRVNGVPIDLVEPRILRIKILEPLLLLKPEIFQA